MGLPSAASAARRAAGLIVARRDLVPPVDVRGLLEEYADVSEAPWPYEGVDAIAIGLGEFRPKVFYRSGSARRRVRFTLAHELGHIRLSWHVGDASCEPGTGVLDLPTYGQEAEADVFASSLLVPDRWLRELRNSHEDDMTAVVADLAAADVSVQASLMALRRALLAGWVFRTADGQTYASQGTGHAAHGTDDDLDAAANDSGTVRLHGRHVDWWRLAPAIGIPAPDADDRSTTELLNDSIAKATAPDEDRRHLNHVVNGKVGGNMREAGLRPEADVFAGLLHVFESQPDLMAEPDFTTYLARKARDISQGTTVRATRKASRR